MPDKPYLIMSPEADDEKLLKAISKKEFIDAGVRKVCDILQTTISGDILVFFTGSNELKLGCTKMHEYLSSISSKINNKSKVKEKLSKKKYL